MARNRVSSETRTTYAAVIDADTDKLHDDIIARAISIIDGRCRVAGHTMTDPAVAGTFAKLQLAGKTNEVFMAMFLDTRHRMLACEELFFGTVDGCEVHPRVVAQRALHHNASSIILAHNHPSGNTEPSSADRMLTARLVKAMALLDIRVLDHFVIGEGAPVSMAARGWI